MVLDLTMRGVLEQYIDAIVIEIPNIVTVFFDHLRKAQLQIQNERFCIGDSFRKYTTCIFDVLRLYTKNTTESRRTYTNRRLSLSEQQRYVVQYLMLLKTYIFSLIVDHYFKMRLTI